MNLVERIKLLATEKKVTFAEIERNTGISNGQIRRWNTSSPKIENIQKVADYFNVSVDYLLGRTDDPNPNSPGVELDWNDVIYKKTDSSDMSPKGRAIGRGFDQLDEDKQDLFERLLKQMQEDDEDDD